MRFFFEGETHVMVSMLREQLEADHPDDDAFVSCEQMHYLDNHVVVHAPDEQSVRRALLRLKEKLAAARADVDRSLTSGREISPGLP